MSYKKIAIQAAQEASQVLLNYYGNLNQSKEKGLRDLVTEADLASEEKILDILQKEFPEHNFITEEKGEVDRQSDYTWIIDPLDGTKKFSRKFPFFGISIGLEYQNEIILGVVYAPATDELFWAEKGKGAFLNDKSIKVSSIASLDKAFAMIDYGSKVNEMNQGVELLKRLNERVFFVRTFAAQVLEFCYVACGRFEISACYGTKPWDYAAAKVIVEEAGGKVTDHKGNKIIRGQNDKNLVATNQKLHEEILKLL